MSATAESAIQSGEYTPRHRSSPLTNTLICATLTACLGAVSFGYVLGYPSPIQKDLKEKLSWNDDNVTWFNVSLICICVNNESWCCGLIFMLVPILTALHVIVYKWEKVVPICNT